MVNVYNNKSNIHNKNNNIIYQMLPTFKVFLTITLIKR